MSLIDFILNAATYGKNGKRRDSTPEELRYFSEEAARDESSFVEGARMLAFEKQDKKCARCGADITEDKAAIRLVTSELGMRPGNVILVCDACQAEMEKESGKEGA